MAKVADFFDAIQGFAPFLLAEKWDHVGLLIGARELPVTKAVLALDLTGAVLDEAVRLGAELVVTHHPVIFEPLHQLDADSIPYRAVSAGLSVVSAHTNLDIAEGGVNDALAASLELTGVRKFAQASAQSYHTVAVFTPAGDAEAVYQAMAAAGAGKLGDYSYCAFLARGEGRFLPLEGANPTIGSVGAAQRVGEVRLEMLCAPDHLAEVLRAMKAAHPYEEPAYNVFDNHAVRQINAYGRIGELARPMSPAELAAHVKAGIGAAGLRYIDGGQPVSTVAVVGGSGGEFLYEARARGAQALVTGEIKHHLILEAAEIGMTIVDGGHFATENVVMKPLLERLRKSVADVDIVVSECCTDGLRYLA